MAAKEAKSKTVLTVFCGVCKREITNVHIRCAECAAVDLCIECFATGSESGDLPAHKRTHAYRVMDNLNALALTVDADWTAREEFMLLDGIDMYGVGNWREIASFIGSKTESQVHKHYVGCYLSGPMAPLPKTIHLAAATAATTAAAAATVASGRRGGVLSPLAAAAAATAAGGGGGGAVAGGGDSARAGAGMDADASASAAAAGSSSSSSSSGGAAGSSGSGGGGGGGSSSSGGGGTPGYSHAHIPRSEVQGFYPLRGDFDVEYENDAEAVLGDLDFVEGEHASETELKLKILQIYNARLDERERRKAFLLERGLLEYKRLLAVERRRPREEREVYDALRPLARFMSPGEHEELVRGIILENRLRKRIAALQEYKRAGVRSLAAAQEYETAKRRKEAALASAAASAAAGAAGGGGGAAGAGDASRERVAAAMNAVVAGTHAAAASNPAFGGGFASGAICGAVAGEHVPPQHPVYIFDGSAVGSVAAAAAAAAAAGESSTSGVKRKRSAAAATPAATAAAVASPAAAGTGAPVSASTAAGGDPVVRVPLAFSLEGIPGAERLSPIERELCERLRLLPNQYFQIKATIVNISVVRGHVRRDDPPGKLVHVDVTKVNGVFDLCIREGWAVPAPVEATAAEPSSSSSSSSLAAGGSSSSGSGGGGAMLVMEEEEGEEA